GTVAAEVVTALPLSPAQAQGVAAALRSALGRDPEISTRVDPAILGGIRVKVGSRLFDASLKSKLDQMKFALKRA
ncbi:MAG TPA: F0F1 ATP synthase subunit delta, partial [Phenylobacterium sp.]